MLILSPLLTLISIVIMPLMFLSSRSVLRVTRRYFKQQQAALGELNGFVEERVSGQRVVKLFSHEEASAKEFDQLNQRLRKTGTIAQSLSGLMGPMMNMINNISYLVIAVSGGYLAARAVLTVGDVFSFLQIYPSVQASRSIPSPTRSTRCSRRWRRPSACLR
jgi:ATP-binding cassette subfamily B protein